MAALPSSLQYWLVQHPSISSFQWKPPSTFASSPTFLLASISSYLLLVFSLPRLLSSRTTPTPLGSLVAIHNLNLFLGSLAMFLGCLLASFFEMRSSDWLWGPSKTWEWLFCFPPGTRPAGRVFFWSYLFYLSKYYELLDTFILVLKRKPLTFLHVFHHAIVVIMSFFWLQYAQSLLVIALLTNTGVHTLMYSYYFLCSLGLRPPWKKLVTNCQILQFVFSFSVSFVLLWLHFTGDGCAGMGAWTFNAFFNASLLVLFVNFHRKQYKDSRGRKKGDKGGDAARHGRER